MSKKISLISLVKDGSVFVDPAHSRIAGVAAAFYPEVGTFESFSDAKGLLKGLSAAFSHAKIVIVGAEISRYIYLKKLLFQALSLETEPSDAILSAIVQHTPQENDESTFLHALIPKESTAMLSDDGLFSGFALKSGRQHLIVLPLDPDRIDSLVENDLTDYLKTLISSDMILVDAAAKNNVLTNILSNLISEEICFAVAANKSSAFIKKKLSATNAWEDSFKFVACDEDKKDLTQKEFIAGLARQAQENIGCPAGMAISNVFTAEKEGGRMFVLVTIADNLRARVAKVYAEPGENVPQLVDAAVETLFAMAGDYVDAGGFTGFPINQENMDIPEEEMQGRSRLAVKLIISGLIAAFICILLVFFGSNLVNAVKEYAGNNANAKQTQTIESTILSTTDESPLETTATQDSLYDPEYLLSLLAQAPSYAAEEEGSSAQTTASTLTNPTKAKTTTQKTTKPAPTTTKPIITQPPATAATTALPAEPTPSSGTFTFNVKGYGHGVGMSQEGAIAYANQGLTYDAILLHYYQPGVTIVNDPSPPSTISSDGKAYSPQEYLARTIAQEIGTGSPIEALKAQAVAAYTYAKVSNFSVKSTNSAFSTIFNMDPNSNVVKAVNAVLGKYLSYNNMPIQAFYFSSCAGRTVSSASVWGGSIAYLGGGVISPETIAVSYKDINTNSFKGLVDSYNLDPKNESKRITLQNNPADWIEIISKDSAGYVNEIRVGDREMRGYSFRQDLLKLGIKSHCFTFTYTPA